MILPTKNLKQQKGFTLLEVIIALFIFTLGILGVAAMQLRAIQGNSSGQRLTEATTLAQEVIERIVEEPIANFAVPSSITVPSIKPFNVIQDIKTMPAPSTLSAAEAIFVTVTVTWSEAGGLFNRSVVVTCIKSKSVEDSYI
ncbi:MAG: prepilin-type N-terminal cleavage/methylation domain-containing protein [Pseudomonadota bacterium]